MVLDAERDASFLAYGLREGGYRVRPAATIDEVAAIADAESIDSLIVNIDPLSRDQAARLHFFIEPDAVEEFECGGMVGASARHLIEKILVGHRLDENNRNVLLRERKRKAQANRACAHHHDGIGLRH